MEAEPKWMVCKHDKSWKFLKYSYLKCSPDMPGKSVEVQKLEAWVETQWMIVKRQNKIWFKWHQKHTKQDRLCKVDLLSWDASMSMTQTSHDIFTWQPDKWVLNNKII